METDDLLKVVQSEAPVHKAGPEAQQPGQRRAFSLKSRQIVGQPAGPGLAMGKARVVLGSSDLFSFQKGEILVCDAVDPGMTFVVPLASGIVERRGGMLIHGAIIAREYGIPCVTGVPDAVNQIKTGDFITVDGHLGIVIIGEATL
jgi:pyruvate,water dikinase